MLARMLLAVETVGRSASAVVVDALGCERAVVDLQGGEAERGLVALLDGLLRAHPVTALAVASGPGSFTGLRVGILAIRTLAWLEHLEVTPVGSLAALAAAQGDGCWWTLLPLKKDTTFHACYRISSGIISELSPATPCLDLAGPPSPPPGAVAIGPALSLKPGLADRWAPGIVLGDPAPVHGRGVARAALGRPSIPWSGLLPDYGIEASPVIQRREREALAAARDLTRKPG